MFKKISLFLVLTLVIGALSACAPSGQLTERKKAEIEDAWYKQYQHPEKVWCWDVEDKGCCLYYGEIDGYDVVLKPTVTPNPTMEKIAIGEFAFEFPYPFMLYAYKDGKLNTLDNLYKHDKISNEMVAETAKRHANKEIQQLSEAKKSAIIRAESRMQVLLDWDAADGEPGAVRYYGNFEGYDVLFIFPWSVADVPGDLVAIDGIEFRVPVGNYAFVAYKDGEFNKVSDLYVIEGVFSREVLEKIIEKHNTYDNG